MMKRRDALKAMGGLAGAATLGKVLPGCGGGDDGPVGITTVVCLMMENRTYDHYFGARKLLEGLPGDGLVAGMSNPNRLGVDVEIYATGGADAVCVLDPPHGWDDGFLQYNSGAMDGFLTVHQNRHDSDTLNDPMSYLTRDHLPASWGIADAYVTCDRWFCSMFGPTWPNRMYWHTGTSQGITSNDLPTGGFNWTSIYHRLVEKEVEYAYYYGDVPVLAVIEDIPGNVDRIFRMEDFFDHAAAGTLPPVVYIDPAFSSNDDHPPHHTMLGQQLIASIYTALANSPQWKNCLFVVTYDEGGGYYDHVAPPNDAADEFAAEGFNQLGVRVPTFVAGPYVKQGEVISTRYDHTSMLKHIENMFGLDPLSARTTAANDLIDCLDLDRLERGDWAPPAEIPAVEINEDDITAQCTAAAERKDDHVVLALADKYPRIIKPFDRRDQVRDYLYMIGDYLERHNRGRIIRSRR
jgi:phospholipase C